MKVCIVGKALQPQHVSMLKKKPPDIAYWGVNDVGLLQPNIEFDAFYHMHKRKYVPDHVHAWLKDCGKRVHVVDCSEWGEPFENTQYPCPFYATSTIAYMLSDAVHLDGMKQIFLVGVELSGPDEYVQQRPCIEFWLGVAMGKGIHWQVYPPSALFSSKGLYGFSEEYHMKEEEP